MARPGAYASAAAEARGAACAGLCDSCLGRMFARKLGLKSARRLGARLRAEPASGCRVCGGMMDSLGEPARAAAGAMAGSQYRTFSVGAVLRPSVAERDDALRARLRARGAESIKSEATREISARVARMTGRSHDAADPDVSVVVDFKAGRCSVRAREVVVVGRYTKSARGIPQRAGSGGQSVESLVAGHVSAVYGCTQVRAGWSGSEDRDSLVGGSGRPFFARAVNPLRRCARLPRTADLGGVKLWGMRRAASAPAPARILCHVKVRARTSAQELGPLRSLAGPVSVMDGRRRAERTVHSVRFRRGRGGAFVMKVVADGGIPIKKLVEGGGVEPSASSVLGCACECAGFDFEEIRERPGRRR